MPDGVIDFMRGGIMVACLGIALFFLKFWKQSREQLFALFAASFLVMGVSQKLALIAGSSGDSVPLTYWLRLLAFLLIIAGIVAKNLPKKSDDNATKVSDSNDLTD